MTEQTGEELATIPTEDAGAVPPNGPGDLDVVRIYNKELDAYGESPRAGVKYLAGWVVVDPEPTPEEAQGLTNYDPAEHSRDEVLEYFARESTSAEEVAAIKVLEEQGKGRVTIIEWEPAEEPDEPTT